MKARSERARLVAANQSTPGESPSGKNPFSFVQRYPKSVIIVVALVALVIGAGVALSERSPKVDVTNASVAASTTTTTSTTAVVVSPLTTTTTTYVAPTTTSRHARTKPTVATTTTENLYLKFHPNVGPPPPPPTLPIPPPYGATAKCNDGSYSWNSYIAACVEHGGVASWL